MFIALGFTLVGVDGELLKILHSLEKHNFFDENLSNHQIEAIGKTQFQQKTAFFISHILTDLMTSFTRFDCFKLFLEGSDIRFKLSELAANSFYSIAFFEIKNGVSHVFPYEVLQFVCYYFDVLHAAPRPVFQRPPEKILQE